MYYFEGLLSNPKMKLIPKEQSMCSSCWVDMHDATETRYTSKIFHNSIKLKLRELNSILWCVLVSSFDQGLTKTQIPSFDD